MCATIAAVIGSAAAVAGTANSIYQSGQGGSFGGAKPPPFTPIDIPGLQNLATQTDIKGYDMSDADLARRFPGLVAENKQLIDQTYKNITGPLDPSLQNAFTTRGIESSLDSVGGGASGLAGLGGRGSAGQNVLSTSLINNTRDYQDQQRGYLDSLLQGNPQRATGLSGEDVTNLSIQNTQLQNEYNQAKYAFQQQKKAADSSGGGGL